ncbi:hypothetical protein LG299_12450 [Microbacterium lacus]|uniref:hypothetical protein n=1 Tax=Microbacterium lacus TaxID=415217 RepID=UPI00384BF290
MAELDTSQAPRGVLAAQRLVAAVAEVGDLAERHYLELKSTLDLSSKRDKEKIAKFVLGAANRMPDIAAGAFEGYAAMVIGVSEGVIKGVPPVEMMELAKIVQQYVGAGGPRWDVIWVPIEGSTKQVLVVLVDPPQVGQPPFACRSSGDSLTSGRIYVRADGETREANADEFDLLLKRGAAMPKVEVDFAIEVVGTISHLAEDHDRTVEEYVSLQRARLIDALRARESTTTIDADDSGPVASGFAGLAPGIKGAASFARAMQIPEDRTELEYLDSIDQWETQFREAWQAATTVIAAGLLTPVIVRVTNRTTTFFHDVEVELHLEGDVFAHDYLDHEGDVDFSYLDLPYPPRAWGPSMMSFGSSGHPDLSFMLPSNHTAYIPPSISFRNGGSVDLDLNVGELRPLGGYESEDEEFVLIITDDGLRSVHGTWQLTARDHNEVFRGEINITATDVCDITATARTILSLDDGDAG